MLLRALKWTLSAILIWVAFVVVLVTPIVNIIFDDLVTDATEHPFSSALLLIDPLDLEVTLQDAVLSEPNGTPLLTVEQLKVNLGAWASLQNGAITLTAIELDHPSVTLRRTAPQAFNIDSLLALADTDDSPARDDSRKDTGNHNDAESSQEASTDVDIRHIAINSGALVWIDETTTPSYREALSEISVAVDNLSTVPNAPPMTHTLSLTRDAGGTVAWSGDTLLETLAVNGEVTLQAMVLPALANYLASSQNFQLIDGEFSTTAHLAMPTLEDATLTLEQARLSHLALLPRDGSGLAPEQTFIKLEQLAIDSVSVATSRSQITVNNPTITGLDTRFTEIDGNLSLIPLFASVTPDAAPVDKNNAPEENTPWAVSLSSFELARSRVAVETPQFKSGLLLLEELAVSLDALTWPEGPNSRASLSAVLNEHAAIDIKLVGNMPTGTLTVDTTLDDLRLSETEPLFSDDFNVELKGGSTAVALQLETDDYLPEHLTGRILVRDFDAHIRDSKNNLMAFEQFRVEGIDINIAERSVAIAEAHITGAKGNLLIREDGSINATRVQRLSAEVSAEAEQLAEESDASEQDSPEEWSITLPGIFVYDSELTFRDESLPVRFTTVIGDLNAEITGFDTALNSNMKIAGRGAIDGYAPVVIAGNVGHFSDPDNGNLSFDMSGVDIARLTPYSTTFLGYPIERGVMSTELSYTLVDGKLKGSNHVIVERLKLGDRTDNQSALDVPIETAVALLTDASGVIDIDLGVAGNVDDPSFQIFDAVWQAAGTMIGNIIAAPFKLLASLAGEETVDDTVRFAAGSSQLDEPAQAQLTTVAKGLEQRPQLALVLQPQINRKADGHKLRRNIFEASLEASGLSREDINRKSEAWEVAIRERAAAAGLAPELTVVEARNQLIDAVELPKGALEQLAMDRAVEVKRHLVMTGNLDPQRATVSPWDRESEDTSGVVLDIDTR